MFCSDKVALFSVIPIIVALDANGAVMVDRPVYIIDFDKAFSQQC